MRRLTLLKNRSYPIWYPEDINRLRESIPELNASSAGEIQEWYSDWSEEYFCAGWLILDEGVIQEFRGWILEDVDNLDYM